MLLDCPLPTRAVSGENIGQKPSPLDYHIRAARPDEADAIHDLTLAAYAEYGKTEAPSSALQETLRDVRERFWSGAFRAAVAEASDGRLVGAVRYRIDSDGLYFFRLGVHPEARRQGIAHAFLDWLEAEAIRWRAGKLRCQVRLIVPRNVELYRSAGFEIVSQHIVIRHGVEVPTATMEKPLVVRS
jgi:ribosomal protein S18 acetylase RimI-like enzyme